jgi:thiamine-phosphate pyrophosphorylase
MTEVGERRRQRLRSSSLYLCIGCGGEEIAAAALRGGTDMVQLRDKEAGDDRLLASAARLRELCDRSGALLWVNDRPDLALAASADGVHVGQDDLPVPEARAAVGPDLLVGVSTHAPDQLEAALASDADQISIGPVWATPTKEGRPAAGLEYVRHAAALAGDRPWFAIGGIDSGNLAEVVAAGARRVVVVRAVRDAADPEAAARALRAQLQAAGPVSERR